MTSRPKQTSDDVPRVENALTGDMDFYLNGYAECFRALGVSDEDISAFRGDVKSSIDDQLAPTITLARLGIQDFQHKDFASARSIMYGVLNQAFENFGIEEADFNETRDALEGVA